MLFSADNRLFKLRLWGNAGAQEYGIAPYMLANMSAESVLCTFSVIENFMSNSVLCRGRLIKWQDDRGFGFIQPVDGGKEVFLHISELKDATRRPKVGDTIYYQAITENDQLRARNGFILGARSKINSQSSAKKVASPAISKSKFFVLEILILSLIPLIGVIHFFWKTATPIPLILYLVMSLVTFVLYADDKSRAEQGKRRTPENTLHLCELAGGWLGGFIAQRQIHHKSRKKSYQIVFWAIVIIHQIFWLVWLFLGKQFTG